MLLGVGSLMTRRRGASAAPPPALAPFASVNADGWSVEYPADLTGPVAVEQSFSITRKGFDSAGNAVDIPMTEIATARVRWPYGDAGVPADQKHPTLRPRTVAVSDYIYAGDVIPGAVNNSAVFSPPPMVRWLIEPQMIVGNSLRLASCAIHRDAGQGRQIAAKRYTITNMSTGQTLSATVGSPALSSYSGWVRQVPEYAATFDISGWADGVEIRADVQAFPRFGRVADGSVFDSVNTPILSYWRCTSIFFKKNAVKFANPPIAVVNTGGAKTVRSVNYGAGVTNGVISTDPTVARATPFSSVQNAMAAIKGATYAALTGQDFEGCEIWIANPPTNLTFGFFNTGANLTATGYSLTYRPDPHLTAAEVAIPNFGGTIRLLGGRSSNLTATRIRLVGFTVARQATNATFGVQSTGSFDQPMDVAFVNCDVDFALNQAEVHAQAVRSVSFYGGISRNVGIGTFTARNVNTATVPGGGGQFFFGHTAIAAVADGSAVNNFESKTVVGCTFTGFQTASSSSARNNDSFQFLYFNEFRQAGANGGVLLRANIGSTGGTSTCEEVGAAGNSFEWTFNGDRPFRLSGDGNAASTRHIVVHSNTMAGAQSANEGSGGFNSFYDEGGNRRTHDLFSVKGNILTTGPAKGDLQVPLRTAVGHFPYLHGVAQRDNFYTTPTGFPKLYPGLRTVNNTGTYQAPGFVDTRTPVDPVSQTVGGGNYRLTSGSALKGANPDPLISHDLDGNGRSLTTDTLGAYA